MKTGHCVLTKPVSEWSDYGSLVKQKNLKTLFFSVTYVHIYKWIKTSTALAMEDL